MQPDVLLSSGHLFKQKLAAMQTTADISCAIAHFTPCTMINLSFEYKWVNLPPEFISKALRNDLNAV